MLEDDDCPSTQAPAAAPPPPEISDPPPPELSDAEAFEVAFMAEIADFHLALVEDNQQGQNTLLKHLATIRAMAEDDSAAPDGGVRRELHGACVTKAREWVDRRTHELVAEFHMRWHEDADLLAVDTALRESVRLITDAEAELGALPVSHEVLSACETQLRGLLSKHVRKANRHELRMIYADFGDVASRAELRELCLDKYREQVDKHVQTEAVQTQMRLQALLDAREASKMASALQQQQQQAASQQQPQASGKDVPATKAGAGTASATAEVSGTTVECLSEYLEGVAGLGEEVCDFTSTESSLSSRTHTQCHCAPPSKHCNHATHSDRCCCLCNVRR